LRELLHLSAALALKDREGLGLDSFPVVFAVSRGLRAIHEVLSWEGSGLL
jgi:hypothetical protein